MDLSPQTLLKCLVLLVLLVGLLLVIAVLYRGEMQNRDIVGELKEFASDDKVSDQLAFARRTLDIKTESAAAHVAVYATFLVKVGERTSYVRRKVYSASMRLIMKSVAREPLSEGSFGFHPERHTRIAKKIAEVQRVEEDRARRAATPFWEQVPIVKHFVKLPIQPHEVTIGEKAVRLSFPINPLFLLTAHPDREVKTSAWLTLLTSFFAVVMQVLFGGPNAKAIPDARDPPAVVRSVTPRG
jgi:hypothetical protein